MVKVKVPAWYFESLHNELQARKRFPNTSQNQRRIQQLERILKGAEEQ